METSALIGLSSSIITEAFKFVPFLRANALVQAITSIVVVFGVSLLSAYTTKTALTVDSFITSLVFALTSYKLLVEPTAATVSSKSQE